MNRTVRSYLIAGYLAVVLLLAVAVTVTAVSGRDLRASLVQRVQLDDRLYDNVSLRTRLADDEAASVVGYLLTHNRSYLTRYLAAQRGLPALRSQGLALSRQEPELRTLLGAMGRDGEQWESWAASAMARPPRDADGAASLAFVQRGQRLFQRYRSASGAALRYLGRLRSQQLTEGRQVLDTMDLLLTIIVVVAVAGVGVIGSWATRSVTRPLNHLRAAAEAIGGGNLGQGVQQEGAREFRLLAQSMEEMRVQLNSQHRLALIIGSTLYLDEVYEEFAAVLQELVHFDRLSLDVLEDDDRQVFTAYAIGVAAERLVAGARYPLDRTVASLAYGAQECVVRKDLFALPLRFEDEEAALEEGLRSVAVVPLLTKGKVVGTLSLWSKTMAAYRVEELGSVTTLAPLVAAAIDNARLYGTLNEAHGELARLNEQLYEQARRDPLTGLGNRLRLREDLEALAGRVERYGHTYSVLLCDVDAFKLYNDRYGHLAGDAVLRAVAETIGRHCRQGDVAYRYGGEEFLIVLPEQGVAGATIVAHRLCKEVEELYIPHAARRPPGVVTVSIGVAGLGPGEEKSVDVLLEQADAALYRAKASGRNRVVIYEGREGVLEA